MIYSIWEDTEGKIFGISEIISSGLIGFKVEDLFKTGARTQYRPVDPWLRQTNILLVLHKSLLINDCVAEQTFDHRK